MVRARIEKRTCQTTLLVCSSVTGIASRRLLTSSPGTGSLDWPTTLEPLSTPDLAPRLLLALRIRILRP